MKPQLLVKGMLGIGDVIHERAVLRELMKQYDVTLDGWYPSIAHDLIDEGLRFHLLTPAGRAAPRIKDAGNASAVKTSPKAQHAKLTYDPGSIKRYGSILAAQFASCGLKMPERADFSLPVKQEWRDKAKALISTWDMGGKPLLIYRPIVLNKFWECPSRSPDPSAYALLFAEIRDRFFVVSIADLTQQEWIVGPEQEADAKLHQGEADFETLAGLFAEAKLVFSNPGFSPILAQAVGTPGIIVYGGNESFRTTNSVGAHLAPTLAIEPDAPCECHARTHDCDKRITLGPAVDKLKQFAGRYA